VRGWSEKARARQETLLEGSVDDNHGIAGLQPGTARQFGLECRPSAWQRPTRLKALIRKLLVNTKGVIVFGIVTFSTIFWFIPLMLITLLKFLIPYAPFRRLMTRLSMGIGENWISAHTVIFGLANSTQYTVKGLDGLSKSKWYLVIVNHQTWVDVIALQTALNRRIPFLKFFVKQQLIWFPVLGIAFWAMDMPFMKRHSKAYLQAHPEQKGKDLEATKKSCERFHGTPTSVINFIEGTRFSEAKRVRRNSPFTHLLPPRSGGMAVALSSMGSMFDAILDVTVVYPRGVPNFWDVMCGRYKEAYVEVAQRPIADWILEGDYLDDREHRRQFHRWLTAIWEEKDARLAELHANPATGS